MIEWTDNAACRGLPLGIFFSSAPADVATARQVCGACPVIDRCREYVQAVEQYRPGSAYGTYAGVTERERRAYYTQLQEIAS